MRQFDENNLAKSNKDLEGIIEAAQFNNKEKLRFLTMVRKDTEKKGIFLDSLKF